MSKHEFLSNFRIAKNLFAHPRVDIAKASPDALAQQQKVARAAIWLTPRSVRGFDPDDFRELPPDHQAQLRTAIADFLDVAKQVPPTEIASPEQLSKATDAFARALSILQPYVPTPDEGDVVEAAVKTVAFPPWIVNWDYRLAEDEYGDPIVWINLYADENATPTPRIQIARTASDLNMKLVHAMSALGSERWPAVQLGTAQEHTKM